MVSHDSISISLCTCLVFALTFALLSPSSAEAACAQWDLSGEWSFNQAGGFRPFFDLKQIGSKIGGRGSYCNSCGGKPGPKVSDTYGIVDENLSSVSGNRFTLVVVWNNGSKGKYTGAIYPDATIRGITVDVNHSGGVPADWSGDRPAKCLDVAGPSTPPPPSDAAQKPVKKLGKLKTTKVAQDVDVYAAPDPADDVKPIGALNFGDVVVWVGCTADKKWCHITKADPTKVPGGDGWVYDGTDRRSLDR